MLSLETSIQQLVEGELESCGIDDLATGCLNWAVRRPCRQAPRCSIRLQDSLLDRVQAAHGEGSCASGAASCTSEGAARCCAAAAVLES
jgi:hypothetical protein